MPQLSITSTHQRMPCGNVQTPKRLGLPRYFEFCEERTVGFGERVTQVPLARNGTLAIAEFFRQELAPFFTSVEGMGLVLDFEHAKQLRLAAVTQQSSVWSKNADPAAPHPGKR